MDRQRLELLKQLRDAINKNDNSNVTLEQVDFYIGEYMKIECLQQWLEDTIDKCNPVTAHEVLYRWNNGFTFEA